MSELTNSLKHLQQEFWLAACTKIADEPISKYRNQAPASGELYLAVNDNYYPDSTGKWTAVVDLPNALDVPERSLTDGGVRSKMRSTTGRFEDPAGSKA